jgi:hypothetical protein
MKRIQIASRLREQLDKFSGIFSPRFSKPRLKFVQQMIFGIQASRDVKLGLHRARAGGEHRIEENRGAAESSSGRGGHGPDDQ